VNTLLTPKDYEYMLSDSRAKALVVSSSCFPVRAALAQSPFLKHVIVSGRGASGHAALEEVLAKGSPELARADDFRRSLLLAVFLGLDRHAESGRARAFEHGSHRELYGKGVLGSPRRRAFFRGETGLCVVSATRRPSVSPSEQSCAHGRACDGGVGIQAPRRNKADGLLCVRRLRRCSPARFPKKESLSLRLCVSAGEALPADMGRRWKEKTGVDILEGIGSTEMLHMFISAGGRCALRATGKPVPDTSSAWWTSRAAVERARSASSR